jgi:hypothetical protein
MTAKEATIPVVLALGLLANAVVVGKWSGRVEAREERWTEVQNTLKEIQKEMRDSDRQYREAIRESERSYQQSQKEMALIAARVAVMEKFMDSQTALNTRLLGHLEARRD